MLRSKSRSADPALTNNPSPLTSQPAHTSSSPHRRAPSDAGPERLATESTKLQPDTNMISTITRKETLSSIEPMASRKSADVAEQEVDTFDARSSSLSDLDDATEDRTASLMSKALVKANDDDFDSEAETERLEKTPRKLNAAHNNNIGAQNGVEKTPSKLTQEIMLESTDEIPTRENFATGSPFSLHPSPITPVADLQELDRPIRSGRDSESPSRKRKRSVSATSSLSEADIPLAKRANSSKYSLEAVTASTETLDGQQEYGNGVFQEDAMLPDEPTGSGVDRVDDDLEVAPAEPVAVLKGKKGGKKGRRKGKKANSGNDGEAVGELVESIADFEPEPVEAEVEDEEDSSRDEERARKQHAYDALRKIEKEFVAFREKHINDQLQQVNLELDLLRRPDSTHPEYLTQLKCINARRDEKIRYEDVKYRYDFEALNTKTVAERTQLHSQYFQQVRETRSKWIEQCYQDLHALQKDRRQWGAHQTNYNYLYNPKRPQLVQQQTAYNLEVSILSGVAKHVGFPAAPDLTSMEVEDIDADFRAMTIPERPPQPQRFNLRDIERSAAEKDFFEQNAWANPSVAHAMAQSQPFATPANTSRILSNGESATTIDMLMMSTPMSGADRSAPQSREAPSRDATKTPSQQRARSAAKLPGTTRDTERIHTTHSSITMGTAPTISQDSTEAPAALSGQTFSKHMDERKDVFGALGHSALTAPVGGGGGGARFPP